MIRPSILIAALLTGCGTQAQVARQPVTELREARFGGDADTLLVTECPPVAEGEQVRCRILRVDLKTQTSVAYEAGQNESLEYPSPTADGKSIMAVRAPRQRDAGGNRPGEIVTFGVDDPRVSVVYRHPTDILHPRPADGGIIFWSERCRGPKDRYCQKEPMFRRADGRTQLVERSYKFGIVGPIVRWQGGTYAQADGSDESIGNDGTFGFKMAAGFPQFWKLDASQRFGVKPITKRTSVMMGTGTESSGLILVTSGEKALGLYQQNERGTERLSFIPNEIYPTGTGYGIALDVSPRTEKIALLVAHQENGSPLYRVTLFDTTSKTWHPVDLPLAKTIRTLSASR